MAEIKKLVTTASVLVYYDHAKQLVVQGDASSTGLGASLLQDGKLLAYARCAVPSLLLKQYMLRLKGSA